MPFAVLGVLGVLLVLMVVYVLTANSVESRKERIAEARQQAQIAEREAAALAPFGNFAQTARTRGASVRALAGSRFDWERLVRELALVLPSGAWLTELDAATTPKTDGASPAQASARAPSGPSANLTGCAKRQPDVAELMVRLGKVHRVTDVSLLESADNAESGGGGAPAAGPPGGSSGGEGGCPPRTYEFKLVVTFEAQDPVTTRPRGQRLPARLGGGS